MPLIRGLLVFGGSIFLLLGLLHALYTWLDIRNPRRLVPDDAAVVVAMTSSKVRLARGGTTMWKAWVGFNFSHSLGAMLFGTLCVVTGASIQLVAIPSWVLLLFVAVGALYLVLGVLYWFRMPAAGIAIATTCLLVAWVLYAT